MRYPLDLEPDTNGTLLVAFTDLPWVTTYGKDEADALVQAADAFDTAIDYLIRERQRIPAPSRVTGAALDVPLLTTAKIAAPYTMQRYTHLEPTHEREPLE